MNKLKFIIITPARNEEAYISKTIESILSQTILPCEWIIVDDGSIDRTGIIAEEAARSYPWIKVVRRPDKGYRDLGSGNADLFYEGLSHIKVEDYKYIFNVDADIILGSNYFEIILAKFEENPKLGIAGGVIYEYVNGRKMRIGRVPEMNPGAVKCWRRECFQEIGGLDRVQSWDCIDIYKAMMLGWQTYTFQDAELEILHLRAEGSSIGNRYLGWARWGRSFHFLGTHPVWVMASAIYHMMDLPYVIGGLSIIIGYLESWLNGSPRYHDRDFRRFMRAWQIKKLSRILTTTWTIEA